MNIFIEKLKEVLFSVVPVTLIVLVLHLTITPLETPVLLRFLIGAGLIIFGLTIFLVGVDLGITPIGNLMGSTLAKSNRLSIVAIGGLLLGFFISVAEPDLHILAEQVDYVTSGRISLVSIVVVVSIGIAALVCIGLVRIVYNVPLYKLLTWTYALIFALGVFTTPEFLAISLDASGATTGAMTVPFLMALALGVTSMKKDSKASEKDSFGLVGIASVGAIIAVMVMSIVSQSERVSGSIEYSVTHTSSLIVPFLEKVPPVSNEVFLALAPILLAFLLFQFISFRMPRKAFSRIIKGSLYTFIGLVIFLVGVNAGFLDVGRLVGHSVTVSGSEPIVVGIGFMLGLVTILAEPAVHVLTRQIEDVTGGSVKSSVVLFALSIGVGVAVALSMLRILVPGIQLWHYVLPGYIIAIAMTYFTPKLFVGMAFDSGGVASGPMTATFVLAFAQGVADATPTANVLIDGFGVIAMVAMTPLIALQILGLVFKVKSRKEGVGVEIEEPHFYAS